MTIEEALRQTEERAALLRFTAHATAGHDDHPSPATWYGIGDLCDQIETLTRGIRAALSAHALATEGRTRGPQS